MLGSGLAQCPCVAPSPGPLGGLSTWGHLSACNCQCDGGGAQGQRRNLIYVSVGSTPSSWGKTLIQLNYSEFNLKDICKFGDSLGDHTTLPQGQAWAFQRGSTLG